MNVDQYSTLPKNTHCEEGIGRKFETHYTMLEQSNRRQYLEHEMEGVKATFLID
jgi:hypothetical protein